MRVSLLRKAAKRERGFRSAGMFCVFLGWGRPFVDSTSMCGAKETLTEKLGLKPEAQDAAFERDDPSRFPTFLDMKEAQARQECKRRHKTKTLNYDSFLCG